MENDDEINSEYLDVIKTKMDIYFRAVRLLMSNLEHTILDENKIVREKTILTARIFMKCCDVCMEKIKIIMENSENNDIH
jgi:hypothetical protein